LSNEPRNFPEALKVSQVCPACGSEAQREGAKFCLVCGRGLNEEDYAPLDSLWASYNLQPRKSEKPARKEAEIQTLFDKDKNGAAATAMAFVVYSLVPYLGILFCPGALLMGGIGLAVSYKKPDLGGRLTSTYSIFLGSVVLAIQILLWWLLYLIPELRRFD
jgi:hypothetical protein